MKSLNLDGYELLPKLYLETILAGSRLRLLAGTNLLRTCEARSCDPVRRPRDRLTRGAATDVATYCCRRQPRHYGRDGARKGTYTKARFWQRPDCRSGSGTTPISTAKPEGCTAAGGMLTRRSPSARDSRTGHHGWLGQKGTRSTADAAGSSTSRRTIRGNSDHGGLIQLRSPLHERLNASTVSHP